MHQEWQITWQQRYHYHYLPIIKLFLMRQPPLSLIAAFALLATALAQISSEGLSFCSCLNGGTCRTRSSICTCPSSFIGPSCHLPSIQLTSTAQSGLLSSNYSYFYFSPSEVNYYRLTFTLCMRSNPSHRATLFYIDSQKSDGSFREAPSLFETAKIVLGDTGCTTFSSHYISVKRREDGVFRKIMVGMKVIQEGEEERYLNSYFNSLQTNSQAATNNEQELGEGEVLQEITLKVAAEVYLQTSYMGTFLILFTAFVLLAVLLSFLAFLRRKYAMDSLEMRLDSLHLQADLTRLRRQLQILNPECSRPRGKNNLHNMQIFMPVTHYGTPQSIFIPHLLANKEHPTSTNEGDACSICLLEFQEGDEIRTTPCSHVYHRQCIDNWCENRLTCPICRRALDFTLQLRQLYYSFLRNDLQL